MRPRMSDVAQLAGVFAYFAELARYITAAAEERDFTILIDQTEGRVERERRIEGKRDDSSREVLVDFDLVERESTKQPARRARRSAENP